MKPTMNLEESPGKWVGRTKASDPMLVRPGEKEDARKWQKAFGSVAPKGVYRFCTHEEADVWLMKMMTRKRH